MTLNPQGLVMSRDKLNGSRTISPKENWSPTPKLTLTLTLKLTLILTQSPTLTRGQFSSGGGEGQGNCPDTKLNMLHLHFH